MDLKEIIEFLHATARALGAEVTSPWFYLQFGLILTAGGIAWASEASIRARIDMTSLAMRWPLALRRFARVLVGSASTVVFAILVIVERFVMVHSTWPSRSYLLAVSAKLAVAWLVIRLVTSVIRNEFIVRLVSLSAWLVAALSVVGQLEPTLQLLDSDSVSIVLGGLRLTPLVLIKLGALLILALWLTNIASNFAESRINRSADLTPSIQVLLVKMIRMGLLTVAVIVALGAVGINLSALAVFSGAVGVGIGIGLQKIVANFISGIILLADKSVKPGDLVTIGDSSGRVPDPERGSGDAEGRELDLYRQEHAGEGAVRHQLRRRSAAGLQTGHRRRRRCPPRHQEQAAELHPDRIRRGRHEVFADPLDRRS